MNIPNCIQRHFYRQIILK